MGMRFKSNLAGYDFSMSASRYMNADREILGLPVKNITGADMAGQIGEIGIWSEAAVINHKSSLFGTNAFDSTFYQVDAGLDFTFTNGLYVMAEYYYNSLGAEKQEDYSPMSLLFQYMGDMGGMARHYTMLGIRNNFLDKFDLTFFSLLNACDFSVVVLPTVDYYWSDAINITFAASLGFGNKKTTELGSLHHTVNGKVKAYF